MRAITSTERALQTIEIQAQTRTDVIRLRSVRGRFQPGTISCQIAVRRET